MGRGNREIEHAKGGGALEEFKALVDAKVAAGMKRQNAASQVAREHPELRQRVVEEANR